MAPVVPGPPSVRTFREKQEFMEKHEEGIFVAIDYESVDHFVVGEDGKRVMYEVPRLSEVGMASLDFRNLPANAFYSSKVPFTELLKEIVVSHGIVKGWSHITASTCPAGWHRKEGKAHVASPYTCMFAESICDTFDNLLDGLKAEIDSFKTWNLTQEEKDARKEDAAEAKRLAKARAMYESRIAEERAKEALRKANMKPPNLWTVANTSLVSTIPEENARQEDVKRIRNFFYITWDAGYETSVLKELQLNGKDFWPLDKSESSKLWDAQLWSSFPANDAFAEIAMILRVIQMDEETFNGWKEGDIVLPEVDLSLVVKTILRTNMDEDPSVRREKARRDGIRGGSGGRGGYRGGSRKINFGDLIT
ncbi:hypothetical protein B0H66DRAFT_644489 [Apodospora peruviana]|uniref:Uncharacterized protein n=1 Tax=Apodospora peruviana TaxID=516989 RepID=A0AAE0LZ38_9PEZI|nr:hypothetical protein B0H66DRAFT_644489 [Apodospora peruviana]